MKQLLFVMVMSVCGGAFAATEVAKFAAQQETKIAERIEREPSPAGRVQTEYLLRQNYNEQMSHRVIQMVRSEKLSSAQLTKLRERKAELLRQLEALNDEIVKAGYETAEVKEQQTFLKANRERMDELRAALWPEESAPSEPSAEKQHQ
ncbi:MAG: hypothetical protein RR982_01110 [Kiritimatiellia bacterium]